MPREERASYIRAGKLTNGMVLRLTDVSRETPPVIAIHGMWARSARWVNFGKFFTENGFLFVAPTLRYHYLNNACDANLGTTSVLDHVSDILEFIDLIKRHYKINVPPIVMGHSMGGLIAQKVAEETELSGLILINSAWPQGIKAKLNLLYRLRTLRYIFQILRSKPFKISYKLASTYVMNNIPKSERRGLYDKFVHESGRSAREILLGRIAVDETKINCPVLVVGCSKDRIVPSSVAIDLFTKYYNIGKHNRFLKLLQQFAHWPQYEEGWKDFASELLLWIHREVLTPR